MADNSPAVDDGCAVVSGEERAGAVGILQTVVGSVTVARTGLIVAGRVGDFVFDGDVVETGADGLAAIAFADGTTLQLFPDGLAVLDASAGDKKSNSALVRVTKGLFGFIGGKLAGDPAVVVDTPFGELRSRGPAIGIGSVALGVFTFAFIRELQADSAHVSFVDYRPLSHKDLKHGVFEIITKGEHPQIIIVDDPTQTIILRLRGSSVSVTEVANSPAQMAQLQSAYANAYSAYTQGLQDPFIQQLQHAKADVQSNPGEGGSSTSLALLSGSGFGGLAQGGNVGAQIVIGGFTLLEHNSTTTTVAISTGPNLPTATAFWLGSGGTGNWGDPLSWSDSFAPLSFQTIIITPSKFTIVELNEANQFVNELFVGINATLKIIDVGSLAVTHLTDVAGTIWVFDPGPPSFTANGPLVVEATGTIRATGANATITFADTSGHTVTDSNHVPTIYTIDNSGHIISETSANIFFEQSVTHNELGASITAQNGASITFDGGPSNTGTPNTPSTLQNDGMVTAESRRRHHVRSGNDC